MPGLILQPTPLAQWHALLNDAQQSCALQLEESLESYLVFLLMRFSKEPSIAHSVLGLEFLEGHQLDSEHARQQQLKEVGDKCLLFAGLFPARAIRKRVKISYFVQLGQSAYAENTAHDPLFALLCQRFTQMMDLLHAIRSPLESIDLLQSYELWHDLGHQKSWERLCENSQALPTVITPKKPLN